MPSVLIPIDSGTNQTVTCTLPVDSGNVTLTFQFTWNDIGGYWFVSVTDSNNNMLLDGVPIITGEYPASNILGPYQYLGIGSAYLVPTTSVLSDNPDFTNLGTDFVLVWSDSVVAS